MERTFEATLVEQCAPTLEGIKPASLFRWQGGCAQALVSRWARELAPFGIAVRILKVCPRTGACLIYLYRRTWLHRILRQSANQAFLRRMGYTSQADGEMLLEQLSDRLCLEQEFPNEIGVFLGYPLEDVVGFIRNGGRNYTCSGCWKAYGDPTAAQRRFEEYRQSTVRCKERFLRGVEIPELISA